MLNNTQRETNKSKGPWGMKNYNFTYRKPGDSVERHRFVTAPSEPGAEKQFHVMMEKTGIEAIVISIEETE
jgi:hypothetical protein